VKSYKQPVKERVRRRLFRHAIHTLSSKRDLATIVRPTELRALVDYAGEILRQGGHDIRNELNKELTTWLEWRATQVKPKRADELRVIYLCGPEPLNDLHILMQLGVNPHNVWAIESNDATYQQALNEIDNSRLPVKLHCGSLKQFFEQVQESFDIAYLDLSGPFLGGKPKALAPVLELFRGSRLNPLSVLITNFSDVPESEKDRYVEVMSTFFRYRYDDVPQPLLDRGLDPAVAEHDDGHLRSLVASDLYATYSDFVSRLIIDLARNWIPSARGMRLLERRYIAENSQATASIEAAYATGMPSASLEEFFATVGDATLSPSSYPLISFFRALNVLRPSEPLGQIVGQMQFHGKSAFDLNRGTALLDRIGEGHWTLASDRLLRCLVSPWFDRDRPFTCDLPFPNLMIHSLLGVYGRPYFASLRDSLRGSYVAKTNRMFCDAFVLDQCRYYFDWFPLVDQVPSRFKAITFQVLARCLMDRIWSSDSSPDTHPFRGSSVAGFYELKDAPFHKLKARTKWRA
jgi:hypothetical protein